ncbi:Protein ALTERED XYLOGLUCAN 4-like [Hibiscus syriacus]|uniref:Protein ALTERED XYLOGLUCAN 4-like n=1 Tax=Hibiscus syriacus TaxID=106335 RepID=A0A6A2Y7Z5_HIBSY|nr:Protein ALTERED XYLOGLUCAN 4-like [Hibiscus syriacus]
MHYYEEDAETSPFHEEDAEYSTPNVKKTPSTPLHCEEDAEYSSNESHAYSTNPMNSHIEPHMQRSHYQLGPRVQLPLLAAGIVAGYDYGILKKCELFKGHWVPDLHGSRYTNSSCTSIPDSKNCFRHGRNDRDFLNWRWKPDKCVLPRFDPKTFLEFVKGKKLGFIGDSVARNHVESLLCLLSKVETPIDQYKDSEDRKRTWYFPNHDFTLINLWTRFLVHDEERMINGSLSGTFNIYLDKIDEEWSKDLPILDYVIISDAHWFFRQIYLHNSTGVVACVYCNSPNVTDYGVGFALKLALRSALKHINNCKNCKARVTLVGTFSPAHFEDGGWNTGGRCNRTSPLSESEINMSGPEWELRSLQMEEIEKARKKGGKLGKRFGVLDVTKAMMMRPDGHPDLKKFDISQIFKIRRAFFPATSLSRDQI